MKAFIITALLAVALAKEFRVKNGGKTCALLTLDGALSLTASQDGKPDSKVSLQFSDATLKVDSDCDLIKLDMTKSAEVWFQFDAVNKDWKVKPESTFVPETVFGKDINDTTPVVVTADPLAQFSKTGSYLCKSATTFTFMSEDVSADYNYTVSASVTGFQIQSVQSETFKSGSECAADAKPKEYECKDGNKTKIMMEGNFTLVITYNKTVSGKSQTVTESIQVPAPQDAATTGSCAAADKTESLTIGFFKDWSVKFMFAKDGETYHITNITVDYTFDEHLPGHVETGKRTVDLPVSKDYLKASTSGYYICKANLDRTSSEVTLTSTDFKYRAFDDKSKGFSGDVSECPADESSSSVVPIAVGAALAGLVVIVLVAYLIGRKRSRKTGYESV